MKKIYLFLICMYILMTVSGCGSSNVSGVEKKNLKELEDSLPKWYEQVYCNGLTDCRLGSYNLDDNKLELFMFIKDYNSTDFSRTIDESIELLARNNNYEGERLELAIMLCVENNPPSFIVSNKLYNNDLLKDNKDIAKQFDEYYSFVHISYLIAPELIDEVKNQVDVLYIYGYTLDSDNIDTTLQLIDRFSNLKMIYWPNSKIVIGEKGIDLNAISKKSENMLFSYYSEEEHKMIFESFR